ncbi:uncharacterized protein N7503_006524 [Penicillium pulvis]|uniref:uncharacterized protein n=1 Tax=Penicillium pulvis TaxID=1562058 RepID=UPI0025498AC6|nr:uncharacterized protein N7503_006524 [Penicillium pulvis]KAJ5799019.1 hypothetical protein N7503_006524 [Penicillium pulvis]
MPLNRTKRTKQVHLSAAVPPPNIRSVPFAESKRRLPGRNTYPYFAQQGVQGMQGARRRAEMIITEISAECTKLLGTNHNTRIMLQKEEEEKAELETQNTLEVEVASRNVGRTPKDPRALP